MSNNTPPHQTDERPSDDSNGQWLEHQLEAALRRWGYLTDRRETAYGLEIDVTARRFETQNQPTDWIVAQCKDWTDRPITPNVIYRLCMLAFACRAMPVLCHTTRLTDRAREIAADWEVRVLTVENLHTESLPAPRIYRSDKNADPQSRSTVRETRDPLPVLFSSDSENPFTYVPGFEPDGVGHKYQLVDEYE